MLEFSCLHLGSLYPRIFRIWNWFVRNSSIIHDYLVVKISIPFLYDNLYLEVCLYHTYEYNFQNETFFKAEGLQKNLWTHGEKSFSFSTALVLSFTKNDFEFCNWKVRYLFQNYDMDIFIQFCHHVFCNKKFQEENVRIVNELHYSWFFAGKWQYFF